MISPFTTTMRRKSNVTQGVIKDRSQTYLTFTMHHDLDTQHTIVSYEDNKHVFRILTYRSTTPISHVIATLNTEALRTR